MKIITWFLYLGLAVYSILDYFHTVTLIKLGFQEANPIVLWLIGPDEQWLRLLIAKVLLLTLVGILLIIKQIRDCKNSKGVPSNVQSGM